MNPSGKGVQVVVRFRPLNETERAQGPDTFVDISNKEINVLDRDVIATKGGGALNIALDQQKQFTFDGVFSPQAKQEDLFEAVGRPVVATVLKGYNGTILAYGQTGSGKTHSMLGPEGGTVDVLSTTSPKYNMRGVIPRLVEELFDKLQAIPSQEVTWKVCASVFELYKENIQDLLTEGPQQEYKIREDNVGGRGVYVDNLYSKQCLSASELLEAVRVGVSRRKVASTKANDNSSRSHSLTVIVVEQTNHVQGGTVTTSRLNLVDLAGSEKIAKTHADGERLKEAQMINLSLTYLGNVINKLTDGKSEYIPYRNSKLTRILQDSLGGNSMTTLLCHCSPAVYNREETLGTLRFAARAKQIKNAPKVNRELSHKELQLQLAQALDRIRFLEEKLAVQTLGVGEASSIRRDRGGGGGGVSSSMHADPHMPEGQARGSEDAEVDLDHVQDDDLRRLVDALMAQVEEQKKDLFAKDEQLSERDQQVEFYKQRATTAEQELTDHTVKWKRDENLLQRRLADMMAENDRLQAQLNMQAAVLVDVPAVSEASGSMPSVSKRTNQTATASNRVTTLRRTAADAQRSNAVSSSDALGNDVAVGSFAGMEVIGTAGSMSGRGMKTSTPAEATPGTVSTVPDTTSDSKRSRQMTQAAGPGGKPRRMSKSGGAQTSSRPASEPSGSSAVSVLGAPQTLEVLDGVGIARTPTPPSVPFESETLAPRRPNDNNVPSDATATDSTPVVEAPVTPPPPPVIETSEIGIMALVGKSDIELQKEIDDIQNHMKQLMSKSNALGKTLNEKQEQISKLNDLLETSRSEKDDVCQELDALKKLLESKEKENEFMKRIMDELNINLSDFQHLLSSEKTRAQQLLDEAEGLRKGNDALRQTAEQQEFVEMATMELLVKTEDMEAVEQDLMRMPTLPTEELFLKKRDFCLQILRQLRSFLDHLTAQLSRQRFNTGNLESRRLQLLDEAATLTARCDDAKTLLKG